MCSDTWSVLISCDPSTYYGPKCDVLQPWEQRDIVKDGRNVLWGFLLSQTEGRVFCIHGHISVQAGCRTSVVQYSDTQLFQKSRGHLKILGVRRVTWGPTHIRRYCTKLSPQRPGVQGLCIPGLTQIIRCYLWLECLRKHTGTGASSGKSVGNAGSIFTLWPR
jgi:hypothetical protein